MENTIQTPISIEHTYFSYLIGLEDTNKHSGLIFIFNNPQQVVDKIENLRSQFGGKWIVKEVEDVAKCRCGNYSAISILESLGMCISCDHIYGEMLDEMR